MWEPIGRRQLEFLMEQGLQPHHYLVDIGCGSLRAGVHLIRYLDSGHYAGMDIDQRLIKAGWRELEQANLADRQPTLIVDGQFDLGRFRRSSTLRWRRACSRTCRSTQSFAAYARSNKS
jgi:hypothetical protein